MNKKIISAVIMMSLMFTAGCGKRKQITGSDTIINQPADPISPDVEAKPPEDNNDEVKKEVKNKSYFGKAYDFAKRHPYYVAGGVVVAVLAVGGVIYYFRRAPVANFNVFDAEIYKVPSDPPKSKLTPEFLEEFKENKLKEIHKVPESPKGPIDPPKEVAPKVIEVPDGNPLLNVPGGEEVKEIINLGTN